MNKIKNGFTLIELLVVISIIALLVSILMPALNKAKQQAYQTTCLANQKALIMGWIMYNDSNNDSIVNHYVEPDSMLGGSRPHSWVEPPQDPDTGAYMGAWNGLTAYETSGGNIMDARKAGIREGALWRYLKDEDVYRCQGDKREKEINPNARMFRTYGLPAGLGPAGGYRNEGGHNGRTYIKKSSAIKFTSDKFVFGEASYDDYFIRQNTGRNYLDQYILNMAGYYDNLTTGPDLQLWIPNSIWHGNSSTYSFADGHAESNKWLTKEIVDHFTKRVEQYLYVPHTNEDASWIYKHYPNVQNF